MGHRSQKNDIGIGYTNFLQVTTFFNYRPSALLVNPFCIIVSSAHVLCNFVQSRSTKSMSILNCRTWPNSAIIFKQFLKQIFGNKSHKYDRPTDCI